jgi:hypothetical protein
LDGARRTVEAYGGYKYGGWLPGSGSG